MKNKTHTQLARLAAHLGDQRKVILKRWRAATEEATGVMIASSLTRVQFNDHIPGVLDASLELETSPGEGSTFRVILPRWYEPDAKPKEGI